MPDDAGALKGSLFVIAVIVVMLAAAVRLGRWFVVPRASGGRGAPRGRRQGRGPIDPAAYRLLEPLPTAVNASRSGSSAARGVVDDATSPRRPRAPRNKKGRLEALLRDLSEGVIVCNLNHEILLYNHMTVRILGGAAEFGLGRTLFRFITREPVLHVLEWLTAPDRGRSGAHRGTGTFVCATADARVLLQGRMSLIVDERDVVMGYVLTLADATERIAALGERDALLRAAIEGCAGRSRTCAPPRKRLSPIRKCRRTSAGPSNPSSSTRALNSATASPRWRRNTGDSSAISAGHGRSSLARFVQLRHPPGACDGEASRSR